MLQKKDSRKHGDAKIALIQCQSCTVHNVAYLHGTLPYHVVLLRKRLSVDGGVTEHQHVRAGEAPAVDAFWDAGHHGGLCRVEGARRSSVGFQQLDLK